MSNTIETDRFMLFAGSVYYPYGGWDDYRGSFAYQDQAKDEATRLFKDESWRSFWWQIVDLETKEIVDSGNEY